MSVALITGGTRGIGKEIALKLSREGFNIAINYRRESDELKCLKEEIENSNVKCLFVQGDVSSFEDCERFVKKTVDELGQIEIGRAHV